MASQRQYEMLFKLNAQMGAQYNSTFKQAQSAMSQFRDEYRNLSSTANDISGYQRQQTAVENTKAKLELLQTQYDNIQKEMDETGGFSSDLANKLAAKKAQIDKTTKAYQDQTARLDDYKQRLETAGVDTSNLDKESERLRKELEQLKGGFKETGDGAKEFGDKGENALDQISAMLAAAGITKMLKEIYDAFSACVQVTGDFEQAMSNVEAISGANAEEIAALTERAKDLGASTAFTAQQVSEGMSYMAMAGWKTNDMLDGMDSVLALAAASGEDLGTTSDIVTDALTAFGLTAKDTGRFADVLAATAANANTNVGMMGETFKYAAPVAGALGYSIEDVAVAVGLMANAGTKGSQAGTTLRNIFNGLLGEVDLTAEAFGDLTLTFENSDGTMMGLSESIDTLRYYFNQMTDAERVQNAINIAGQRGYSGLINILKATTEDYNKLSEAINNSSGAAQRMADIKLDNMNGQLTIAKSAWEGLQIAVGEQFTPVLKKLYTVAADVLGNITKFVKENPNVVKAIAALAAGLGTFVVVITAAKIAQAAFNAIAAMNPYVLLAGAVVAVTTAIIGFTAATKAAEEETEELSVASQRQADHIADLQRQYEEYGDTASTEAQLLRREIEDCTAEFEAQKKTVQEAYDDIQKTLDDYAKFRQDTDGQAEKLDAEYAANINLIESLRELTAAENQNEQSKGKILAIVDLLNERLPELGLQYDALTGRLNMTPDDIKAYAESNYARSRYENSQEEFNKLYEMREPLITARNTAQEQMEAAYQEWQKAKSSYNAALFLSGMVGASDERSAMEAAEEEYNSFKEQYDQAAADVEAVEVKIDELTNTVYEFATAEAEATEQEKAFAEELTTVHAATTTLQEGLEELAEDYNTAYEAAYKSITGQYALWDSVDEITDETIKSVEDMNKSILDQTTYWAAYNDNLQYLYDLNIDGLDQMVASFADGSTDSVNAIAGMRAASEEDLTEMVNNWLALRDEQQQTSDNMALLVTDFGDRCSELQSEFESTIGEMDLSDEAWENAQSTVQGFIDGAYDMLPAVRTAYASVGQAAIDAIESKMDIHSPSRVMKYEAQMTWAGFIEQTRAMQNDVAGAFAQTMESGLDAVSADGAYATPEGVRSPATSTQYTIHFAPAYNLSGAADTAEVRAVLAAHDDELRQQLLELLQEEREDAARRAYV